MNFGQAIEVMKDGEKVKRGAWGGRFLSWVPAGMKAMVPHADHFAMTKPDGTVSNWAPTMEDLAADDWQLV